MIENIDQVDPCRILLLEVPQIEILCIRWNLIVGMAHQNVSAKKEKIPFTMQAYAFGDPIRKQ